MSIHRTGRNEWTDRLAMDARLLGEARMLREDQELTPEITDAIVKRFKDVIGLLNKSQTWAARSISMSATVLSQVLEGTYAADREIHLRKIDKWTEIQYTRVNAPKPKGYAKTTVALEIIGASKMIQKIGGIGIVHGPSGIGKSLVGEFIRSETPGSILIRATSAACGIMALYDLMAAELRLTGLKLTAAQMEKQLVDLLIDTNRLIIVDEVQELAIRSKDKGLHALRHLHDITGCPMLWFGTADLSAYIEDGRMASQSAEQIYGRVTWWLDLTYAASRQDGGPGLHTVDDIRKVVAAHQWRVSGDGIDYLHDLANEPKMGGLRTIVRVCRIAAAKFGDRELTRAIFEDLQEGRLGKRASGTIQTQMKLRKRKVG